MPDILAGGEYRSSVNVNTLALSYCLRAYSCLGAQTRSNDYSESNFAENADSSARGAVGRAASVFARLVMEPYLQELFTLGNLDGGAASTASTSASSHSLSPSSHRTVSNRGSCAGLPFIFHKLCAFVRSQCSVILQVLRRVKSEMAEELMSTSIERGDNDASGSATAVTFVVDILSDGIWSPIAKALENKFGSQLFSFAQPDRFHRNYSTCKQFLEHDLPLAAEATFEERDCLRSHAATAHFWSLWSLPIYFGLRQKEMNGVIEQAMLDFAELQGSEIEEKGPGHVTKACLGRCWDRDKVFMRRLAPQFFELSLELGSSYISWLESEVSK